VAAKAAAYLDYLHTTGVPDYQATTGNREGYVSHRIEGDQAHFLLLSLWDSSEAMQQFAGADMERARYSPEDEQFLIALEPTVMHYEGVVKP